MKPFHFAITWMNGRTHLGVIQERELTISPYLKKTEYGSSSTTDHIISMFDSFVVSATEPYIVSERILYGAVRTFLIGTRERGMYEKKSFVLRKFDYYVSFRNF